MKKIDTQKRLHSWGKVNLVTQKDKFGFYDEYICENCGIKGRSYDTMLSIMVNDKIPDEVLHGCKKQPDTYLGKKIKITECTASGKVFSNFTPESVHTVVEPPEGYFNGDRGVFVMGIGEPVKLLFWEFNFIKGLKRTTKPRSKQI